MRFVSLFVFALVAVTAAPGDSYAGRKAGVTMKDTINVAGKQLTLNGMGLREATVLKVDVYVAGLYLENPSSDPAQILASNETKTLVLKFVRDVDRDDIVKAWNDGFKNNAVVSVASLRPMIDQLNSWMRGFSDGDMLVFTYLPEEGLIVEVNGSRRGVIKNDDFAHSLFAIWLGPKPPNAGLKKGLLGDH